MISAMSISMAAAAKNPTAIVHCLNPGPSVIDGPLNRVSAATVRMVSRRGTATMMHRVTDPARRKNAEAVH